MPHTKLSRIAGALCGAGLLALAGQAAAVQPAFTGLFVIGDSLSDDGNLAALGLELTGQVVIPPPYFEGRLSNGPVAVEYLAAGLGLAGTPGYVNLAIAGARTGTGGQFDGTGMLVQTAGLLAKVPSLPSEALYMVWGGANDLRNGVTIETAVSNLSSIVTQLHDAGARSFLLPNMPDLGLTPESRERGAAFSFGATSLSNQFNDDLKLAYDGLAAQWVDERFYFFDAEGYQRAITAGAPGNGFTNVSARCFDERVPSLCATPASYLYWDNIHPTAAAHQILGNQMLAAVPEPQTMLLMAVGVAALLGLGGRRQRSASPAA